MPTLGQRLSPENGNPIMRAQNKATANQKHASCDVYHLRGELEIDFRKSYYAIGENHQIFADFMKS